MKLAKKKSPCPGMLPKEIDAFLKGKTKAQLIGLVHEIAEQYPEIAQHLADRQQIISGNAKTLVTRLLREIRDISSEPSWRNYWQGEGYTPDYSGIRKKLQVLLQAGHAGEVLIVGRELVTASAPARWRKATTMAKPPGRLPGACL